MEDTLFWYGKVITEKRFKELTPKIKTVYVDLQNLEFCEPVLHQHGFILIEQGYELTGINDLKQYKFTRN